MATYRNLHFLGDFHDGVCCFNLKSELNIEMFMSYLRNSNKMIHTLPPVQIYGLEFVFLSTR